MLTEAFLLAFVLSSGVNVDAISVSLFEGVNFVGLIYQYNADIAECHNVEAYARGIIGSAVSDTCLMVFEEENCHGNSYKVSRDLLTVGDLRRQVTSFHPCTKDFGGDKIRVDMYDSSNQLAAEFKDICGCQDIASQIYTNLKSLNNYGNCVRVYSSPTCTGNDYHEVPAGESGVSQNLPELGFYVRSISGCGVKRNCVNLEAKIFKYVIISDDSKNSGVNQMATSSVELSTKTSFINNGSATVSQVYEARKKVKESTTMTVSKAVTGMKYSESSWGVGVEVKGAMDIPGAEDSDKANGKISASIGMNIGEAYRDVVDLGSGNKSSHTKETEKEYVVRQTFQIPACVEYEVFSTLTMVENLPIIYEIHAYITGDMSGERLTAEEVQLQVSEMTFVGIHDEYTAIFKTAEPLIANMGIETMISGAGKRIPNCQSQRPDAA